jgi:hypothetical protein
VADAGHHGFDESERSVGNMMTENDYLKNYVYDGVANEYARLKGIPLREALDTLYRSRLYSEIRRGVSDMHCRSDGDPAEELSLEMTRAEGR